MRKRILAALLFSLLLIILPGCTDEPTGQKTSFRPVPTWEGSMSGSEKAWMAPAEEIDLARLLREAVLLRGNLKGEPVSPRLTPGEYLEEAARHRITLPECRTLEPDAPVNRAQVLATLYRAVGSGNLPRLNAVEELPDYSADSPWYSSILTMYEAGIWQGGDVYGTLEPDSPVSSRELALLADRILHPENRLTFALESLKAKETIVYGQSGAGRDLLAYRYGEGENVLVVAFAIHGWEDCWDRDGQMLVDTAELLKTALDEHYFDLVEEKNWSVYVLPCLNPDGLYDGTTCNGPGRCTTRHLDREGNLVEGGIDMNRCFPYIFYTRYGGRNYNGSAPLQAPEAQAVAELVQSIQGSGNNVLIDTHGWYGQIIVSGGWNCPVYEAFRTYFPQCYYTSLRGSAGYFPPGLLMCWAMTLPFLRCPILPAPRPSGSGAMPGAMWIPSSTFWSIMNKENTSIGF